MEKKIKKFTNSEEMMCYEYQELKQKNIELQLENKKLEGMLNKSINDVNLFYNILNGLEIEENESDYNNAKYYRVKKDFIYDNDKTKQLIDKFMKWKKDFEKEETLSEVAITDEKEQENE